MTLQNFLALGQTIVGSTLATLNHLPGPALGALLIVAVVCVYESLGNSRLTPGRWR